MLDFLKAYSPGQILFFVIFLAIAFKQAIDFKDWFKDKVIKRDAEIKKEQENKENVEKRLEALEQITQVHTGYTEQLKTNLDLLLESDKDAIKAYIIQQNHFLCYKQKWVDDYTMECLERRYEHYKAENGNSFVRQLMDEIRALPKRPYGEEESEEGE